MKNHRNVLTFSLATLLLTPALQADEAVTLRYKFSKSDKLIYRNVNTIKQTQTVNGKNFETEMQQTDVSVRTFSRKDDKGNLRIKTRNKQLKIKAKIGPLGEYTFDSQSDDLDRGSPISDSLNSVYELLSGANFTFTITPLGKVVEVRGYKELLEDALKENPLGAQFLSGGTDEAAKLTLGEQLVVLPEKPVEPGDTWEVPYEINLPKLGKFEGKKTYTYVGADKVGERATAKIHVTYDLTVELDIKMEGVDVTGTLSIEKSSGTIHFDTDKGQLVLMNTSFTMSGDLTVDANGMMINVKTKQTQNGKVELLDKIPE